MSSTHCELCGVARRPTQQPIATFSNAGHPTHFTRLRDFRDYVGPAITECSPTLMVDVSMHRNGGGLNGRSHMCDDCIVVGLRQAKRWVDEMLAALAPNASDT